MIDPTKFPFTNRGIARFATVLLGLAALLFAGAGCGGGQGAVAKAEARRAAHVKAAKLPPLPIETLPSGDRAISLDSDLYFAFDKATLTLAARRQLHDQVAPRVRKFLASPGARVELRGYTDGVGESAYNLRLSSERAAAVRYFLLKARVPARRLAARGFGEKLASSARPDGALRRVDVVLHRRARR
jgi:outer membrane protein OmpA-like peptidoglycan-associated protein